MSNRIGLGRPMERRDRLRRHCRTPVRIYTSPDRVEDDSFVLESGDLSETGLFLRTDLLFPVGEWLDLELEVPGRVQPVCGRGRVVRVDAKVEGPGPGVALLLKGLSDEEQTALCRLGTPTWRVAN